MVEIKQLIVGKNEKTEDGFIVSCSVVLIKTDKNILVDVGTFHDKQNLIDSLDKEGLKPEDIDIIILTHCHVDHTANLNLFTNADIYYEHKAEPTLIKMRTDSYLVKPMKEDQLDFGPDIKVFSTTGHMQGHVSVLVKTDKGNIVIAGDAISTEANLESVPGNLWSEEKYVESQKMILEMADFIIPGHGKMFEVKK